MSGSEEENFEKLEAYIDGVLDAGGQMEVERLMAANPQLRAMVSDLTRGRQMLMALPRVAAPADVAETFQGHLERAALLGDSDSEEVASPLRIHRWPQFMSIAAMLLLAVGLFAVIYQILPKNGSKSSVAIKESGSRPRTADPLIADGATRNSKDSEKIGEPAGKFAGGKSAGGAGGSGGGV